MVNQKTLPPKHERTVIASSEAPGSGKESNAVTVKSDAGHSSAAGMRCRPGVIPATQRGSLDAEDHLEVRLARPALPGARRRARRTSRPGVFRPGFRREL